MTIKVTGKGGISATIIAHSKSAVDGKEIISYELEYHRYVHSELMTHRTFSRNAASSRAIPVAKMIDLVRTSTATPIHWGKNQAGMQSSEEVDGSNLWQAKQVWGNAANLMCNYSETMSKENLHKQITNRLLEPFQMVKVVVTATEWDNFFWLRFHKAAQPEIQELARCMLVAKKRSVPEALNVGEWHTPYVRHLRTEDGLQYVVEDSDGQGFYVSLEEALHVSASCSAQVSYRKTDNSLEKGERVWQMLTTDDRLHGSPMEHQATPMECCYFYTNTDMVEYNGVTHIDKDGKGWSNNFKGWIQHRALIPNNNCTSFDYTQEIDETGLEIEDNNNEH